MKNGDYVDEEIILFQKNRWKRKIKYDLLTDEIPVCGKRLRFQWFSIFDGKFRILLPEDFVHMPEQIARVKYICSYRPPIIFTSPGYDENFGFHLLENEEADLDKLLGQMQKALLLGAPETIIYEKGSFAPLKMEGRWFEYKNFTLDEETYNMQFLIYAEGERTDYSRVESKKQSGNLLVGTFNCRMAFYDQWKPLVLKILEQIEGAENESR